MSDWEFIIEATERLCPKSEWHGDSDLDNESLANISIQEEMLRVVWENLFRDVVVYGQEHNASAQAIMQRKREALMAALARAQDDLHDIGMFAPLYYEEAEANEPTNDASEAD
jgi:hypothetical protein